ncbi:MAG: hypothetical protein M4579_002312 [Chaenotheca gracillima]|nr:MAG: hypothetical protein M4579_002312 [Chaenotheca gracillima]
MPSHLFIVRLLGHATLCGILHVAWQNPTGVGGRYMACILFKSCLILSDVDNERVYKVVGCIDLRTVRIENTDSGKGLQCHTAPYSWKIIFESDQQMLEIIVSACSKAEEQTWKSSLNMQIKTERADMLSGESVLGQFNPTVTIDIKPLAQAFGQPGSVARRISRRNDQSIPILAGSEAACYSFPEKILKNANGKSTL